MALSRLRIRPRSRAGRGLLIRDATKAGLRNYPQERPALPRQLQERATRFLGASPAFTRGEFAAAVGLPEDSATIGRLLKRETDAGRLRRLNGGVLAAGPNSELPGPFAVPDCVYASKLRPDGVLGYHTVLELYGISCTVLYNTVHLISSGRPGTVSLSFQRCRIVRPHRTLIAAGNTDFLTVQIERQGVPMRSRPSSERWSTSCTVCTALAAGTRSSSA